MLRADPGQDGRGGRHEHQARGEPVEQHRAEGAAEVGVPRRDLAQPGEARGEPDRADHEHRGATQPAEQPGRDPRHREDPERQRQEREAGGQRAEAELALEVLHGEEEHRHLAAHDQRDDRQAAEPAAAAQQRGLDHRVRDAGLGDGQHDQQQRAEREAADGADRGPALLGGADQRPHDRDGTEGGGQGADDVEAAGPQRGLVEHPPGQREHGEPDRDVDEQRPPPGAEVGHGAAEQQAERHAARGHGAEQREGAVAGRLVGGAGGEQGEHARGGERGADALGAAGGHQPLGGLRQAAGQGGQGEDGQADLEGAAAAEDVPETAAEEQQAAEGEGVGVEHPGQPGRAEVEGVVDVRQRDVHDGRVEDQHQLGHEDDRDAGRGAAGVRRQVDRVRALRGEGLGHEEGSPVLADRADVD